VIRMANSHFEELFDYGAGEVLGKTLEALMPDRFREHYAAYCKGYLANPEPHVMGAGRELIGLSKTGNEIPLEVSLAPIQIKEEALVVGTIIDLRKRKEAEEILAIADRNKSEFLAILGHELRNPLMALKNAAELMRINSQDSNKLSWALDVINHQAEDLNHLVDELLDLARIEQGHINLESQNINVETIIEHVTETIQWIIDKKKQTLIVSPPEKTIFVNGDLIRLSQVLVNLLHNASKFTPEGKTIWLEVYTDPDKAEIKFKIRDEGIGFTKDEFIDIFNLFSRGAKAKNKNGVDGLGIGLALARRLVELHHGELTASSQGPQQGSEFTVRLPLNLAYPIKICPEIAISNEPAMPASFYRILIIDDHPNSAESTAELFKVRGHETCYAETGREGIELAKKFKPEIVLIDIVLPDISGYECAKWIRKNPDTKHAKLIAITGMSQSPEEQQKHQSDFDCFFIKPINIKNIEQWVALSMKNS
jgi:PAS domain S-box-containing protein